MSRLAEVDIHYT